MLRRARFVRYETSALGIFGVGKHDEKWRKLTASILADFNAETATMESINFLLKNLGEKNVTLDSFWGPFFETKLDKKISIEKIQLNQLVELVATCNSVEYRPELAISKLISALLTNETVWIVSPSDLVQVALVIADSRTEHKQLFGEIATRVEREINEFSLEQLVSVMNAFAKINFSNRKMFDQILAKTIHEFDHTNFHLKTQLAIVCSKLRVRSDTFFKQLCKQALTDNRASAELCVAMRKLKMHTGSTQWWDRESDYSKLVHLAAKTFTSNSIQSMSAPDLDSYTEIVKSPPIIPVMHRIKELLTKSPMSKSHKQLASILENLAKTHKTKEAISELRWLAEWLCNNVYILSVADIASINRSIAKLGFKDHSYHKIWIAYYLERLDELNKEDIATISDNFNAIGMSDTLLGGRHFFYKLGKRFQDLTVEQGGDKELNSTMKYRNLLQRLG